MYAYYLFQLSWISDVVLQLFPTFTAQVAGSSCPLNEKKNLRNELPVYSRMEK